MKEFIWTALIAVVVLGCWYWLLPPMRRAFDAVKAWLKTWRAN